MKMTAEWKDTKCSSSGATSTCSFKNAFGEEATLYGYDADFNFLISNACDDEKDADYKEIVKPIEHTGAFTASVSDTLYSCTEYSKMSGIFLKIFEAQFSDLDEDTYVWTSDGLCAESGIVAQCEDIVEEDSEMVKANYYYSTISSSAETDCSEVSGTWTEF
jgi:hypothetical protein